VPVSRRLPCRVTQLNRSSQIQRRLAGRLAWKVAALALVCGAPPTFARTSGNLPQGVPAGPFVLSPYVLTSVGYDDNLFRSSVTPQAEAFTLTTVGIGARLPVRNSWLDLNYQIDKRKYSGYQPNRPREQTFNGAFQFNFGTGDTVIVQDTYSLGSSDVRTVDAGGELLFRDAPFTYNRAAVVWQRTTPSLAGFTVGVAHVDVAFDAVPGVLIPFFDYNGTEMSVEYRHPIPGRRWLRGFFESRRFDHFEHPDVGSAYRSFRREEHTDTLQVGMGGVFGHGHSFDFRVGYGQYRLIGDGAEFRGVVGRANVNVVVGGRTRVTGVLWRRPLPSNFDTYYIVNSLRVSAERSVARNVSGGVAVELWRNGYLDPVPATVLDPDVDPVAVPCQCLTAPVDRTDQRLWLEGYLEWLPNPRVGIRLAARREQRNSNAVPLSPDQQILQDVDFTATGVSLALRLGWF